MVTIQKMIDKSYQNVSLLFNLEQIPRSSKKVFNIRGHMCKYPVFTIFFELKQI